MYDLEFKQVTGKFSDLYVNPQTGEHEVRSTRGYVYITPAVKDIYVTSVGRRVNLDEFLPTKVKVDADGEFTIDLLVTDQDKFTPINWTYEFKTSWSDAVANLPITEAMPDLININEYFNDPSFEGQIINVGPRGADGRGITSITASGNTATVHYTDNTTSTFTLPVGSGGGGGVNNFEWVQNSAAADWVINHNLNRNIAACYVVTGTGIGAEQVYAQYSITDLNTIVVHHGAACSGKAILI